MIFFFLEKIWVCFGVITRKITWYSSRAGCNGCKCTKIRIITYGSRNFSCDFIWYSIASYFIVLCFVHPIFSFCFWSLFKKIQKYYLIFVHILQGKMGKTEKNMSDQNTKNKNTKIWEERNIKFKRFPWVTEKIDHDKLYYEGCNFRIK